MSIDAMKQALAALEQYTNVVTSVNDPNSWVTVADGGKPARDAITALRAAIEQAQEPVAWISEGGDVSRSKRYMDEMGFKCNPLYTAPRQWHGLTDEDREDILRWIEWKEIGSQPVAPQKLIAYVEKKLKERNK